MSIIFSFSFLIDSFILFLFYIYYFLSCSSKQKKSVYVCFMTDWVLNTGKSTQYEKKCRTGEAVAETTAGKDGRVRRRHASICLPVEKALIMATAPHSASHFNYETYYKHQEKPPAHTNPLLQYLSDTELRFRNDNLYETELSRLPRRTE